MLFSVGIELPQSNDDAFGLIIPALCNESFSCYSSADTEKQISLMATDAITMTIEEMLLDGVALNTIVDKGVIAYQQDREYSDYNAWLMLDVDVSKLEGKPKRINISIPDVLVQRIDDYVKHSAGRYKDRSDFIASAARNEMQV